MSESAADVALLRARLDGVQRLLDAANQDPHPGSLMLLKLLGVCLRAQLGKDGVLEAAPFDRESEHDS